MQETGTGVVLKAIVLIFLSLATLPAEETNVPASSRPYLARVQECVETLMKYGTDRYGKTQAPILVSILDIETRECPINPEKLDEYFRVTRRGRRSPAGSNFLFDQTTLKSMYLLSAISGKPDYADFADGYAKYVFDNLVDQNGFFWWGWHRHYNVHRDFKGGHDGNHHEIHAMNGILWNQLWAVDKDAVTKKIEAIWRDHVINKQTGEINRHGDGQRGCDFSMSAGAYIEAFAFIYAKTHDQTWLDRAMLLADYYWNKRNPKTDLFPERPNAGNQRFDGSSFVTAITGLHCHSLLRAYAATKVESFRDYALAYLKAYAKYGYDEKTGKFWGALRLDGTPILGPRVFAENIDSAAGYAAAQPRGHLDLWEPYVAGYQYAIYTAQAYVYAYHLTRDAEMLTAAKRFAAWISNTPPGTIETDITWYKSYSEGPGLKGTYAGKYGRTISFFLHLHVVTGEHRYLDDARSMADTAIKKLYHNGLFRGHPVKPYYEAIDGVGYLLYALLQLDQVLKDPQTVMTREAIVVGNGTLKTTMDLDNW